VRLVRYRAAEADGVGVLDGERLLATGYEDMRALIADDRYEERVAAALGHGEPVAGARLLAPLHNPGKMLFLGRSFRQFRGQLKPEDPPFVYSRVASSIVGPGDAIRLPGPDQHVLYEGELLIVIGKAGRRIGVDAAMAHVFGYTQVNDVTWTDWIHGEDGLPQITLSKNADTFCPMGPCVVTRDEFDPVGVTFTVTVNGEVRTTGTTGDLAWSVPEIIAFLSRDMTLWPGDVIATGTSDAQPIAPGDKVVIEFAGLGRLENPVELAS
jgi:2-keto-4-pentenoate hydratase/2-oxohepta-3-ene-1,7-dioic acid hydratase in catechol pathway